jgi:hypothetical protein
MLRRPVVLQGLCVANFFSVGRSLRGQSEWERNEIDLSFHVASFVSCHLPFSDHRHRLKSGHCWTAALLESVIRGLIRDAHAQIAHVGEV